MRFLPLLFLAATVAAIPAPQDDAPAAKGKGLGKGKGSDAAAAKGSKGSKGKGKDSDSSGSAGGKSGKLGGKLSGGGGGGGGGGKVHLIFARGSTEIGTMGAIVGPAFSSALGVRFGVTNFKSEGVPYAADIIGAVTGAINPKGSTGAIKMADMAKRGLAQGYKVVLSGYSQGAEMVHGALMNLGSEGSKIAAAVTFGDPLKPAPYWGSLPSSRAKIFCNNGDGVCGMAFVISAAHMTYSASVAEAVAHVQSAIRSMGG